MSSINVMVKNYYTYFAFCLRVVSIDRQRDRQTDRRTDGRTDERIDGHTDRQAGRLLYASSACVHKGAITKLLIFFNKNTQLIIN